MKLFKEKFLNNLNNKWPATIFAHKRTDKVIGRIIFDTNSIKTIKFINTKGVPIGTKWDNIFFALLYQPNIIKEIQNVKEIGKVIIIWAEGVKIKGNKAKKLIMKIVKNNINIKKIFPFFKFILIKGFNSLLKGNKIIFTEIKFLDNSNFPFMKTIIIKKEKTHGNIF